MIEMLKQTEQTDLPVNRRVTIDSNTLEMVLRLNGAGFSLSGDIVCDIRRALGEDPTKPLTAFTSEVVEASCYRDLRDAVCKLRRIYWDGVDVDKNKVSVGCLALFSADNEIAETYHRLTGAWPDKRAQLRQSTD